MKSIRGGHFDVVVLGGGAAGTSSAVAAARSGARVLLIERYGFLGGAAANALVLAYCGFFLKGVRPVAAVGGIGADLLGHLVAVGQDIAPIVSKSGNWIIMLDAEAVKFAFDQLVECKGLDTVLHSCAVSVSKGSSGIDAITVNDHAGCYEVSADAFVDASGEATLASLAGVPLSVDSRRGDKVQPASLPIRIGGVSGDANFDREMLTAIIAEHNATAKDQIHRTDGGVMFRLPLSDDYWWMSVDVETDGLSGTCLGKAEQQARRQAWRNLALLQRMPGFEKAHILSTGPQLGIRETRRPRSCEDVTGQALTDGTRRSDGVARAAWPMEVHEAPGRARFVDLGGQGFADIPLEALRASGCDNLFLAGRTIGADPVAYGSVRVMGTAFATGHAAGIAAAKLAASGVVQVSDVRRALTTQGALI